ncbi:MAG: transcriptional repressor LexA [Ferrimicrobium sp.]
MNHTNEPIKTRILDFITASTAEHGYPPSIREIALAVGLSSPSSVHHHLRSLERSGKLKRDPTRSRAVSLTTSPNRVTSIPLFGAVGAGFTVVADPEDTETLEIPASINAQFAVHVRGSSMVDLGIFDGDTILVRAQSEANDGDIVVASIDDDIGTLKTLRKRGGRILLEGANHTDPTLADPIDATETINIHGRLVGLWRTY